MVRCPERRWPSEGRLGALMLQTKKPGAGPGSMEVRMSDHDKRQAGAEIEVTSEMIQAGAEVLIESGELYFEDLLSCHFLSQCVLQAALQPRGHVP